LSICKARFIGLLLELLSFGGYNRTQNERSLYGQKIRHVAVRYVYLRARLIFVSGFQGLRLLLIASFYSFIDSGKAIDHLKELFPAITIQVPLKHQHQTP
jgi:hypothetical protein